MNDAEKVFLLQEWVNGNIELEILDFASNDWSTLKQLHLPDIRVAKPMEIPVRIWVNVYKNGKIFAHKSKEDAESRVDEGWGIKDFITLPYICEVNDDS